MTNDKDNAFRTQKANNINLITNQPNVVLPGLYYKQRMSVKTDKTGPNRGQQAALINETRARN